MKKVLALLLAVTMVFGLAVSASAAIVVDNGSTGGTINNVVGQSRNAYITGVNNNGDPSQSWNNTYYVNRSSASGNMPQASWDSSYVYQLKFGPESFTWYAYPDANNNAQATGRSYSAFNKNWLNIVANGSTWKDGIDYEMEYTVTNNPNDLSSLYSTEGVYVTIYPIRNGTYRNVYLRLRSGNSQTLAYYIDQWVVDGANNMKITGVSGILGDAGVSLNSLNGNDVQFSNIDVEPDDELFVRLKANMFEWSDSSSNVSGVLPRGVANVTTAQLRTGKITVRTKISKGSKAFDDVKIDSESSVAYVSVQFVDPFVSVDDLDWDITVYLVYDGKRVDDSALQLVGNLANPIIEVDSDDDTVDLSEGYVAEAIAYNSKIEVDLGNDVYITTKMFKDKKYYGIARRDDDEADDVVIAKYPDIDSVFTLYTIGLNSTGDIVTIDLDGDAYYVYNKDMQYIGMSTEKLPYSTKYYLANKKLDVADDSDDDTSEVVPGEVTNPITGGDGGSANVNYNPGTGR